MNMIECLIGELLSINRPLMSELLIFSLNID